MILSRRYRRLLTRISLLASLFLAGTTARAIVVIRDPGRNTTPPTGELMNSGWQYEGEWHGFTGTAIGPHNFLTAAHVRGYPGQSFVFHGVSYTALDATALPGTDLCVWTVSGTLPTWAPLYQRGQEVGRDVVLYGRGLDRGAPIRIADKVCGWRGGNANSGLSWGRSWVLRTANSQDSKLSTTPYGDVFTTPFDADAGPDAACVSPGDSGGGVFIKDDDGVWKLAGIIYGVETGFYRDENAANSINGSLFDTRGVYRRSVTGQIVQVPLDASSQYPIQSIVSRIAPYATDIRHAIHARSQTMTLLIELAMMIGIPALTIVVVVASAVRRVPRSKSPAQVPSEDEPAPEEFED